MSKSDEIAARAAKYNRIERVADSLGRVIGVRRLKPSQQLRIEEFAGSLTGSVTMTDEASGSSIEVPRRLPLLMAAAVCEIDDTPVPFPKSRGELDAILDVLDDEGMVAVASALSKINTDAAEPEASEKEATDRAKNSRRAPNTATS